MLKTKSKKIAFILTSFIFSLFFAFNASATGFTYVAPGTATGNFSFTSATISGRWSVYESSSASSPFSYGTVYSSGSSQTMNSVYGQFGGTHSGWVFLANDDYFNCYGVSYSVCASHTGDVQIFNTVADVVSFPVPPPPPGFNSGTVGTALTSCNSGDGTGALGIFASVICKYGIALFTFVSVLIGFGLAYLVFRFGWRKVKGSII